MTKWRVVKARAECGWSLDLVNAAHALHTWSMDLMWEQKWDDWCVQLDSIEGSEGIWSYDPSRVTLDELRAVIEYYNDCDMHRVGQTMKHIEDYDGDWRYTADDGRHIAAIVVEMKLKGLLD